MHHLLQAFCVHSFPNIVKSLFKHKILMIRYIIEKKEQSATKLLMQIGMFQTRKWEILLRVTDDETNFYFS